MLSQYYCKGDRKGNYKCKHYKSEDYTLDKHKKVDDTPFGGGAGMVLMCQPYFDCFDSIDKSDDTEVILLSPQGEIFNHSMSVELSKNLI